MIQLIRSKNIINFDDGNCNVIIGIWLLLEINKEYLYFKNIIEYENIEDNINKNKLKELKLIIIYDLEDTNIIQNFELTNGLEFFLKKKRDILSIKQIININNLKYFKLFSVRLELNKTVINDLNIDIYHIIHIIKNINKINYNVKSKSFQTNEILRSKSINLFNFIKNKFIKDLYIIKFYFIIDNNFNCYWYNISDITIKDDDNIILLKDIKYNIEPNNNKLIINNVTKCNGIYCNFKEYFQEIHFNNKYEENYIFLMENNLEKSYKIEFKLIFFDILERESLLFRIKNLFKNLNINDISNFDELLLLKLRTCKLKRF